MKKEITLEDLNEIQSELFIEQSKHYALIAERILTGFSINKLSDENESLSQHLELVWLVSAIKYFPNDFIKVHLQRLGIYNTVKEFLIPIQDIAEEIEIINNRKVVYMNPELAFGFISIYLDMKILTALLNYFNHVTTKKGNGWKPINKLHANVIRCEDSLMSKGKYKTNKDYNALKPFISIAEKLNSQFKFYDNILTELKYMSSNKQSLSELLYISERVDKNKRFVKNEIAFEFHRLFSLLSPKLFKSEETLDVNKNGTYATYKKYFYGEVLVRKVGVPKNSSLFAST